VAQVSLTSLRKTFKYGGRRNVPSQLELDALVVIIKICVLTIHFFFVVSFKIKFSQSGRVSKRQMFLLPGGVPILLNIRSYTVNHLSIILSLFLE
jgi:hypothetical protein